MLLSLYVLYNTNTKVKSSPIILFYSQVRANNNQDIGSQQLVTYPVCHTVFPSVNSVGEQNQECVHECTGNILENK